MEALVKRFTLWLTIAAIISAVFVTPSEVRGQSQTDSKAPIAFEVASIKPSERGRFHYPPIRVLPGGQTYLVENVPVRYMMQQVYHIISDQISGGPGWMNTDSYDIQAKAACAPHPERVPIRRMLGLKRPGRSALHGPLQRAYRSPP